MRRTRTASSRSPRSFSPTDAPKWQFASAFEDRLRRIYGRTDPLYVLRLAERSQSYRELIRRYSNDSML